MRRVAGIVGESGAREASAAHRSATTKTQDRGGDSTLESARKVESRHPQLKSGDRLLHGVTPPRRGVAGELG